MASMKYTFTSESVCEGHPDKVCDYIADSILDAYLAQDRMCRVACEVLCKGDKVVLAGEITSTAKVDPESVARAAIREIGYTDPQEPFNADDAIVSQFITEQAPEITAGVDPNKNRTQEQGAGDQGIMFGYATDETSEMMPLPILLAHRLSHCLAEDRKKGTVPWLRPDGKTQVSVQYEDDVPRTVTDVVVSTQHTEDTEQSKIREYVSEHLAPHALGAWLHPGIRFHVNPTGSFASGGPSVDCGVTGRKIIVDTYGGAARHGGGAFSGKDPSKVDRSGAYFCRFVVRQIVKAGLARRAEVQVAYAIGRAREISTTVNTFGTGDARAAQEYLKTFDFRPAAMIERLNLLRPIYRQTTNYGHFGRPGLSWEE
jgi:S-adenosylmethionine synthetase